MRSGVVSALVLAACGFHSGGSGAGTDDAAGVVPDVAVSDASGETAVPGFCDPADLHVVACFEFEGSVTDLSHNHLTTMGQFGATFDTGETGMAMNVVANSIITIADSPALDINKLTMEAWIKPSQLPTGGSGRAYVADAGQQYYLYVDNNGDVFCTLTGGPDASTTTGKIMVNQWTHVACTYDGVGAIIYVDGVVAASKLGTGTLSTSGTGMEIGGKSDLSDRLVGLIDELRIMDQARTPLQICADAGKSICP